MSENENNDSYKHTSSIPLKKETVRVTLKASDAPPARPHGASKDEASAPPSPKPTARPTPPVPSVAKQEQEAPAAAAPSPTPDSGPPTSTPPPAPTAPKAPTAPAAGIPKKAPAPTVSIKTAQKATLPGTGDTNKTTPSLPKATVALNPPTRPLTANADQPATATATATASMDEDESGAKTFNNILAGVGLAAAIIVLSLQLSMASTWISAEDNENQGEWSQLLD